MKYLILLTTLCSCTLFNKSQPSDEMEKLTETVLKKNEGVDIQVTPITPLIQKKF